MSYIVEPDDGAYAALLTDNLTEVSAELRTIDLVDLVSFIRCESFGAIEDLIHSSTELFFKPGTLISAWTACADLAWDGLPAVTLGLEFRHPDVSVFFDLLLSGYEERVMVRAVLFEAPMTEPKARLRAFSRALADARLPRRAAGRTAPAPNGRILPR